MGNIDLQFKQKNSSSLNGELAHKYAEGYKSFLDKAKTEREATIFACSLLEQHGFIPYTFGDKIEPNGKYYFNNRGKGICAIKLGRDNLKNGIKIAGAHIDSPRLDLKQHPLYEDDGMAYFKTHYYGGIRKYQWVTIPLSLHGVCYLKGGKRVDVVVGEADDEPQFIITDLLPHLAQEQSKKPLSEAFSGEDMNILIGIDSLNDDKDGVKNNILQILFNKYGITEEDFISSELSIVPANKARDIGFDRSMIASYGHDDRVCAYPALTSFLDDTSDNSTMCLLVDKEEIGSDGVTGMQCSFVTDILEEFCSQLKLNFNLVKFKSQCLSADVSSCYDPMYKEAFEKNNVAKINCGLVMCKYTGARGKSGTSDASAEFVSKIREIFDKSGVIWQTGELGKVDLGGGGTIAKYVANRNIETVDIGVPVLSMHSPYEVISKKDLYSCYQGFLSFYKS